MPNILAQCSQFLGGCLSSAVDIIRIIDNYTEVKSPCIWYAMQFYPRYHGQTIANAGNSYQTIRQSHPGTAKDAHAASPGQLRLSCLFRDCFCLVSLCLPDSVREGLAWLHGGRAALDRIESLA